MREMDKSDTHPGPPPVIQPRPQPPYPVYQPMASGAMQSIPPLQPIDPQPKPKKDRACDLCRRKKTRLHIKRCDYDQRDPQRSCSSCTSYGETCTFNEAAQKRGPLKSFVEGLEERLQRVEKLLMDVANSGKLPQPALRDLATTTTSDDTDVESVREEQQQQQQLSSPAMHSTEGGKHKHDDNDVATCYYESSNLSKRRKTDDSSYSLMGSSSGVYMLGKLFPHHEKPAVEQQGEEEEIVFPKALQGYGDDLMVARHKVNNRPLSLFCIPENHGPPAWNLPAKEVVDRLVELYFKRMNVFLPILDQDDFYEGYKKGGDSPSKPLLVAVCRSACRLLDEDDWIVKKYNINRGTLFEHFRAQLSRWYRPDFLEPRLEGVQILLLTACTANKWTAESVDWLAISIAVKMAQDLGLHRSHACDAKFTKVLETRRRVWWCAYVLDRWIAATLGRPLTISDADCDVEVPSSSDENSAFLVHFIRVSAILGDVLRVICSPRARGFCDKRFGIDKVCQRLEEILHDWEKSLPERLRLSEQEFKRLALQDISLELDAKLNYGAGQLRLAYNSVLLLLQRPFIAIGRNNFDMPDACRKSVKEIISIFEAVQLKSLLSFSWSVTSYVLCQALMITFMNLRNIDPQISDDAMHDMERFANQYRRLEAYITEPSILPFLDTLTKIVQDDKCNAATNEDDIQPVDATKTDSVAEGSSQQASTPFLGASSGLDWQDFMVLLADSVHP